MKIGLEGNRAFDGTISLRKTVSLEKLGAAPLRNSTVSEMGKVFAVSEAQRRRREEFREIPEDNTVSYA